MIDINTYIVEKLKINKDIDIPEEDPLKKIILISGLSSEQIGEEESKIFSDEIKEKWIDKYNITKVECIISENTYTENTPYFKSKSISEDDYRIDDEDYKYFDGKSKNIIIDDFSLGVYVQEIIGRHIDHAIKIGSTELKSFQMIFVEK